MDIESGGEQVRHNYVPLPSYDHAHIGQPTSEQDVRFLTVVSFINEAFRFGNEFALIFILHVCAFVRNILLLLC